MGAPRKGSADLVSAPSDINAQLELLAKALAAEGQLDLEKYDRPMLLRFLKARQGDVAAARAMWTKSQSWRKHWGADKILTQTVLTEKEIKRLQEVYPHGLHKTDALGRPVLVYKIGATNIAALRADFKEDALKLRHIQTYEFILRVVFPGCSAECGQPVDQLTTIIDLQGMGIWDMAKLKDLLLPTLSMNADNYPETLGALIIVNAPMGFSSAFEAVKSFLAPETQKKIQVLGRNYQPTLAKLIPKENLVPEYGGSSKGQLADNMGPWQKHSPYASSGTDFKISSAVGLQEETESSTPIKATYSTGCLADGPRNGSMGASAHFMTTSVSAEDLGLGASAAATLSSSSSAAAAAAATLSISSAAVTKLSAGAGAGAGATARELAPASISKVEDSAVQAAAMPPSAQQPPRFNMLVLQEDSNMEDSGEQFFTPNSCITPMPHALSARGSKGRTPSAPWMSYSGAGPVGQRNSAASSTGHGQCMTPRAWRHEITGIQENAGALDATPEERVSRGGGGGGGESSSSNPCSSSPSPLWSWFKERSWFRSRSASRCQEYNELRSQLTPSVKDSGGWDCSRPAHRHAGPPFHAGVRQIEASRLSEAGAGKPPPQGTPEREGCHQRSDEVQMQTYSSPSRPASMVKSFSRKLRGRLMKSKSEMGPRASLLMHDDQYDSNDEYELQQADQCCIVM